MGSSISRGAPEKRVCIDRVCVYTCPRGERGEQGVSVRSVRSGGSDVPRAGRLGSDEGHVLAGTFSVSSHGWKSKGSSEVPSLRALIPSMRAPPSGPNHLPKAPL